MTLRSARPAAIGALVLLLLIRSPIAAAGFRLRPSPVGAPSASPQPPRAAPSTTGTSRIRGRVVASDNGHPLRRAVVRAFSAEAGVSRTITTDAEGRYELTQLRPGAYLLKASKPNFVSLGYGQARQFGHTRRLELAADQTIAAGDFKLPRAGVIALRQLLQEVGDGHASRPALRRPRRSGAAVLQRRA